MAVNATLGSKLPRELQSVAVAVLGAGAPHASLMAGALAYIYRKTNKTFDIFFTSGGGSLIGLLFVAPKRKHPDEALRDVAEFGVDDRIYRLFPVGYKTFFKNSRYTSLFHEWANRYKLEVEPRPFPGEPPPHDYDPKEQRRRRLYNDLIDFWFSALTPPALGPTSRGLCAHLPFLEEMVDFTRVNVGVGPSGLAMDVPVMVSVDPPVAIKLKLGWFYVNAYNLGSKQIEQFANPNLTPRKIKAALSFPLVYPPEEVDGAFYCEGADVDPLNLPSLKAAIGNEIPREAGSKEPLRVENLPQVKVYLFDILGSLERDLMYTPRDLWDAYGLSLLTPVVSLAKRSRRIFELENPKGKGTELVAVKFAIPRKRRGGPLDWSYANTTAMWDAGWEAGREFIRAHGDELPERVANRDDD